MMSSTTALLSKALASTGSVALRQVTPGACAFGARPVEWLSLASCLARRSSTASAITAAAEVHVEPHVPVEPLAPRIYRSGVPPAGPVDEHGGRRHIVPRDTLMRIEELSKARRYDDVRSVFEDVIVGGYVATKALFQACIQASAYPSPRIQEMFWYYDEMARFAVRPDRLVFLTLMVGCNRANDHKAVFRVYEELRRAGCEPDAAIFQNLLEACAGSPELTSRTKKIWEEMLEQGVQPVDRVYAAVIDCCRVRGDLTDGLQIFENMPTQQRGMSTRNSAIHMCGALGDLPQARIIFDQTTEILPEKRHPFTYGYMFLALVQNDQHDEALQLLLDFEADGTQTMPRNIIDLACKHLQHTKENIDFAIKLLESLKGHIPFKASRSLFAGSLNLRHTEGVEATARQLQRSHRLNSNLQRFLKLFREHPEDLPHRILL